MRLVSNAHEGQFWVWDMDHQGQVIESNAWWDGQIRPYLDAKANSARAAIDVGASIGWFTCYLAKLFNKVVAVEAHPGTFEILTRNVREVRGLPEERVSLVNAAAYDRRQGMRLASGGMVGWPIPENLGATPNASSVPFIAAWDGPALVESVALDEILPTDLDVALIKLDSQGCDLRAMRGLKQTILRCRPRIVFEYEAALAIWHGDTWQDYLDFLERIDYKAPLHVREDVVDWVTDPKECP